MFTRGTILYIVVCLTVALSIFGAGYADGH